MSRQIGEWMHDQGGIIDAIIAPLWFLSEVLVNFVDDIFIIVTTFMSWKVHMDFFNASIIVGKVLKICFQYYLEGFLFQGLDDEYRRPHYEI